MVLFRDEELQLLAEERARQPRWRKNLRRTIKGLIWLGFFFGLSLLMLSTLSGKSDALKQGAQQYLAQMTGLDAEIGKLEYMSFFPALGVSFSDLKLYRPGETVPHGAAVGRVGHVTIVMGFWDMFFSRNAFRLIDIRDADLSPAVLDRRPVTFEFLRLDPKGWGGKPAIMLKGRYGDEAMTALVEMRLKGRAFTVPSSAHIEGAVGPLHFAGTATHDRKGSLRLIFDLVGSGDREGKGSLTFARENKKLKLIAELVSPGGTTLAIAATHAGQGAYMGTIAVPSMDSEGIAVLTPILADLLDYWPGASSLAVDISAPVIKNAQNESGSFRAHAVIKDSTLTLSGLSGTLPGGRLKEAAIELVLPEDASAPECLAARLRRIQSGMVFEPVRLLANGKTYEGRGQVKRPRDPALALSFRAAKEQSKGCALP